MNLKRIYIQNGCCCWSGCWGGFLFFFGISVIQKFFVDLVLIWLGNWKGWFWENKKNYKIFGNVLTKRRRGACCWDVCCYRQKKVVHQKFFFRSLLQNHFRKKFFKVRFQNFFLLDFVVNLWSLDFLVCSC